jgi:multiple sugar transport system ATP-binding protein
LSQIVLRQVSKAYTPGIVALDAVDLTIPEGERMVVLGPSGSGKTTLLRLIAGLETPDTGTISIGGRDMDGVPPHRRDVAMVFQNPALYPHLSVFENLVFGLKARRIAPDERRRRVHAVAGMLGLERLLDRRPAELSGGESQRVALGRAVAREPRVLLLDEPFGNLDDPLRAALRGELVELHRRFGSTVVHVTHDQSEALSLGQRLAVLHQGRLMQVDTPREIYDRPAHRFVASFIGSPGMNILPCEVAVKNASLCVGLLGSGRAETQAIEGDISTFRDLLLFQPLRFELGLRPESVSLVAGPEGAGPFVAWPRTTATIRRVEYQGNSLLVSLAVGDVTLVSRVPTLPSVQEGHDVTVYLDLTHASWFDPGTGRRWDPCDRTLSTSSPLSE